MKYLCIMFLIAFYSCRPDNTRYMGLTTLSEELKSYIPYSLGQQFIFKCDSTNEIISYKVEHISDTIDTWSDGEEEDFEYNDYNYWDYENKSYLLKSIENQCNIDIQVRSTDFKPDKAYNPNMLISIRSFETTSFTEFKFDSIPLIKNDTLHEYRYIPVLSRDNHIYSDVFITKNSFIYIGKLTDKVVRRLYFSNKKGIVGFELADKRFFHLEE